MGKQLIVDPSLHLGNVSAAQLAESFGKPVVAEDVVLQRAASWTVQYWRALVGSSDHLKSALHRPTASEKKSGLGGGETRDTPEGRMIVPAMVARLMDMGYSYQTADKMLSQMIKQHDAYLSEARYIPEEDTSWMDAYKGATSILNKLGKQRKANEQQQQVRAFQGAHVAQELETLPKDADAETIKEAVDRARTKADDEMRRQSYSKAIEQFLNKNHIPPQDIPLIVNMLEDILQDWQQRQSSSTVEAAEVESTEQAQGIETPTPALLPERQRDVA